MILSHTDKAVLSTQLDYLLLHGLARKSGFLAGSRDRKFIPGNDVGANAERKTLAYRLLADMIEATLVPREVEFTSNTTTVITVGNKKPLANDKTTTTIACTPKSYADFLYAWIIQACTFGPSFVKENYFRLPNKEITGAVLLGDQKAIDLVKLNHGKREAILDRAQVQLEALQMNAQLKQNIVFDLQHNVTTDDKKLVANPAFLTITLNDITEEGGIPSILIYKFVEIIQEMWASLVEVFLEVHRPIFKDTIIPDKNKELYKWLMK